MTEDDFCFLMAISDYGWRQAVAFVRWRAPVSTSCRRRSETKNEKTETTTDL